MFSFANCIGIESNADIILFDKLLSAYFVISLSYDDKISAFGLMWCEAEPELETYISSRTAETNLRPTGVRMKYAHELNETFQKITEKKNSIKKDLLTKMSLLDERIQ